MTALDDALGAVIVDTVNQFGKSVSLIRVSVGTYDPTTSSNTKTEATSTIKAIVEDFKPYELANGLATVGDKKLTVAASGLVAPNLTDYVMIDAVRYAVVSVGVNYSGELVALYILHGRKS